MAGKKGQVRLNPSQGAGRQRLWQSMRILRRFCLPDLLRTTGARDDNARRFVLALEEHGYLVEAGEYRRAGKGVYKWWTLIVNPGPKRPLVCHRCGKPLSAKICQVEDQGNDRKRPVKPA